MTKEAEAAPQEGAPKKSKKLVVIILASLVILFLVAGGAVFVLLSGNHGGDDEGDEAPAVQDVKKAKKPDHSLPPVFVNLDPFTVNLKPDDNGDGAYMQVAISLQVDDAQADEQIKNLMPRIRNDVMLVMSDKQASQLASREGKEAMAGEIKDAINSIIGTPSNDKNKPPIGPVDAVLFPTFIIQ